jgi:hypothetical protein
METKKETTASIALGLLLNHGGFDGSLEELRKWAFIRSRSKQVSSAKDLIITLIYQTKRLTHFGWYRNQEGINEGIDDLGRKFLILQALWELRSSVECYPNFEIGETLQYANQASAFWEESIPAEECLELANQTP